MLQNYVSIESLINSGYATIYNKTYDYETKDYEILEFKRLCQFDSILCVGAGLTDYDIMRVAACANCLSVTAETQLNSPNYVGSAYWYYTPTKSFGFSPSPYITQNMCDNSEPNDNLRLCWHTSGNDGGFRAGNVLDLNTESFYSKYVFLKTSEHKIFLIIVYIILKIFLNFKFRRIIN